MANKISRRNFIENTSLAIAALSLNPFQNHESQRPVGGHLKKQWLKNEPLIMVGCWDTFPLYHQRRQDGNPEWFTEMYKKQQSEEAVKALADLGVTMAVIHFFKGFGLKAEQEHMEDARKLTDLCHKYKIRVGVYIGSTIMYETFLLEEPDAEKWFVPPYLGTPVRYGDQEFRKLAYFMYPEYIDYIKKVMRIAIKDFGVDLLHFDNTSMRALPSVFQHPLAKKHFLEYLEHTYTEEERKKRFGFSNMAYVEPPLGNHSFAVIDDPMVQEWMNFRCQLLAGFCEDINQYANQLNPDVAIEHNPSTGFNGTNTMWEQGIDYPRLLKQMDIAWTEDGSKPHITDDGILISKIRTYKGYTTLKNQVFTYTNENPLELAEAMAFNRQCLGWVGDMLAGLEIEEVYRRYIRFYREHFEEFFQSVENVADVAVLRTYATMAHNVGRPYQSTLLFEQTLIQGKILWDMIFDQQLNDLSKYKVLILANQESLSDSQVEQIEAFVNQGGGVIITEHSSLYKPPHRRRAQFGLKNIMIEEAPEWTQENRPSKSPVYPEPLLNVPLSKHFVGKGRVAYIPEVIPVKPKPLSADMLNEYWHLPQNWKSLIDTVKWASGSNLSLEVEASETIVAELMEQTKRGAYIVHLLNYDEARQKTLTNIKVKIQIPNGKKVKYIRMTSPDREKEQVLTFNTTAQWVSFTVPILEVYDLIVVETRS